MLAASGAHPPTTRRPLAVTPAPGSPWGGAMSRQDIPATHAPMQNTRPPGPVPRSPAIHPSSLRASRACRQDHHQPPVLDRLGKREPLGWHPRHLVPAMPLVPMSSDLGSLDACTSIRKSSSPGPSCSMQIRPQMFTAPHVWVTAPLQRGARDSHFAWRATGTGTARLRWPLVWSVVSQI